MADAGGSWLLGFAQVEFADGETQNYALPLALAWEDSDGERMPALRYCTLAQVRQHARVGIVYDAFWDRAFCRSIVKAMGGDLALPVHGGKLVFNHTRRSRGDRGQSVVGAASGVRADQFDGDPRRKAGAQMLSALAARDQSGDRGRPILDRCVAVSAHRSGARRTAVLRRGGAPHGARGAAAIRPQPGSGWNYVIEYLRRYLDQQLTVAPDEADAAAARMPRDCRRFGYRFAGDRVGACPKRRAARPAAAGAAPMSAGTPTPHASFLTLVAMIGQRTGELHVALAATSGDPAFDPEPVSTDDVAGWIAAVVAEVDQTFDQLSQRQGDLPPPVRAAAERLLAMRASLKGRIAALAPRVLTFTKTRFHGDFHLGQLLVVEHDFIVVDFEGEPFRPMDERRRKHSPLRDVAGMLRSFSYAAAIALDEATSDRAADRVRAAAHMTRWERETAAAFLTAYARAVRGASSYPSDPVDVARLIDLFVLEKALYEVRYELGSRPDWVRIPIAGLLERMQVAAAVS